MRDNSNHFSLDEDIERRSVPALKVHPKVLGSDADNLFAARAPTWVLTVSICLAILMCSNWAEGAQTPLRVMPLGDSITQGESSSYRQPLWLALDEAGISVDFIGSMSGGYSGSHNANDYDTDHEGHWGWRADQVLRRINQWAKQATPDIVLMHLGTNDIGAGQDIDDTVDEIDQIIDRLREHNPQVHVLVAAIIPVAYESATIRITQFNEGLARLVNMKHTPTSRVVLVDHFTGFDAAQDTYDGIHPNERGNHKMAERWLVAIQSLLKSRTEN